MMPGKKKKYNARFPPARIKKIMQTDEEVGKVAAPVPVIISRALELFAETLLSRANDVTVKRGARTLTPSHLKLCIETEKRFDFLKELVSAVPDLQDDEVEEGDILPLQPSRTKPRGRGQSHYSHVNHGDRIRTDGHSDQGSRSAADGIVPTSLPPPRGTGKRRGRPPKVNGNIGAGILRFHQGEKRKGSDDQVQRDSEGGGLPKKSPNGLRFRPILPSPAIPYDQPSPPVTAAIITSKHLPGGNSLTSRLEPPPPPTISRSFSVPASATAPPLDLSSSALLHGSPKNSPLTGTVSARSPPGGVSHLLHRSVSQVSNGLNGSGHSSHLLTAPLSAPPSSLHVRTEAGTTDGGAVELKKSVSFSAGGTGAFHKCVSVEPTERRLPDDDTAATAAAPSSLPAIDSGTHNIIRSLNSASVKSGVQRLPGSSTWTLGKPSPFAKKDTLDEDYDC